MKRLLPIISIIFILSCSSDEEGITKEESLNEYSYFLELDIPQFKGNVNGSYMIYQFGHNTYQMGSSSWNPKDDPKEPTRKSLFVLNQENGNNQFVISTPTYDSSSPAEVDEVFGTGIKKLGPGPDNFYIQIRSGNSTFKICEEESVYEIEVLKSKEIFVDHSGIQYMNVWFKIDKVHSANCSGGNSFNIQNALILAQFVQK
ncbi:hypothetical protein FHG64_17850 [Antarcticibacterium flavum]|uniref:Lipoprotein n=1 Tax=Antarcticibacterium flavum TaxID=2058175 RepID=A0A5B7X6U4_9FLAO|nr:MULTISPECIES: hypothetical protein [Antarcticibacterium]MCM4160886.1 hypothetical protein [Antarcticibacterium sp. W02-3]QCY71109.1 hypothetical protein FHG64_17850 [Antarcticibacterium flavum]